MRLFFGACLQLRACVYADAYCSPLADRVRHSVGQEYEDVLVMTLRTRQLVFESEATLRAKGLSKTPDVRLLLPIGVKDAAKGQRLHVVHWIDSKAMFGDRYTHDTENASQVRSGDDVVVEVVLVLLVHLLCSRWLSCGCSYRGT